MVEDFVANVAADKRINGLFGGTDIPRIKRLPVQQICVSSRGPYKSQHTRGAPRPQRMRRDFDALVEDRAKSLSKLKVPQGEPLARLGPMRKDVAQIQAQARRSAHDRPLIERNCRRHSGL